MISHSYTSKCKRGTLDSAEIYKAFTKIGMNYGKAYQGIDVLSQGNRQLLAQLRLPNAVAYTHSDFLLHPSLMDSALQASIGLITGLDQIPSQPSLPFALKSLRIVSACAKEMVAWVRYSSGSKEADNVTTLDVDLCDQHGNVCVQMQGFAFRPLERELGSFLQKRPRHTGKDEIEAGLHSFVPVWNPVFFEPNHAIMVPESTEILLLGTHRTHLDWVQKSYPNTDFLHLPSTATIEIIQAELKKRTFDQLLWIAPDVAQKADDERIIEQQEYGIVAIFRIIKALLHVGFTTKALQWTIITTNTQRVKKDERVQPTHAGLFGLIGSLAKEHPHWNLRLLDVDRLESVDARECLTLTWDKQGDGLAYRRGEWFQHGLAHMGSIPQAFPGYKQKGVYVVIGGAGGLGEVWSRFMVEQYQARIVWIGRREMNEVIQDKVNALSRFGHAPIYISADATQWDALEQAHSTIQQTYPVIHGVVHSAIVLQDQSIAHMEESRFRAGLSAKVDISVNMDRVFGEQELDVMLFFSSMQSFIKAPGQSNYAAGCTFKDSFAQTLAKQRAYPVKIMNWGYWGHVGIVADESYNKRMQQLGIGSIEPQEGMASLQTLVRSEMSQIALLKDA